MKKLQRIRSRWPQLIQIKKEIYFALREGDDDVGYISLKPGAKLRVVEIKPEHAIVVVGDAVCPVPVEYTDLLDRLGGIAVVLAMPDDPPPADETTSSAVIQPPAAHG
jgi:hypothetical protein